VAKNLLALTGNDAGAYAVKQVQPDVAAVFPITPQTELMHKVAEYVADGVIDTELITVESEHSAMSATVGAAAGGARTFTATAANGFALMWEIVYIASSLRLPIVMALINRALSAPINIHGDHSDSMGGRDTGWIQFYSEGAQEVYDNLIQAYRIAEHKDVLLPVMATFDGFIISHTTEIVDTLTDDTVRKFVGEYKPAYSLLDIDHPITVGPLDLYDWYFEHKRSQIEATKHARKVILDVADEFYKLTGRKYGYFDEYRIDDAEAVIVVLGSAAGTTKCVVDKMRKEGKKVGVLKLRVFRPFPAEEIANALKDVPVVGVLDRMVSFGGWGGPVFNELRSAMYNMEKRPEVVNYHYGLGGRDINTEQIEETFNTLLEIAETGEVKERFGYIGLRE